MSAEKPALDPNTVKMWMLSANDMNDDDLVSCGDVGVTAVYYAVLTEALCFPFVAGSGGLGCSFG